MEKRRNIARVLLVVSFMFTIVFQFIHSFEHISSFVAYEEEHSTHAHFTEHREQLSTQLEWKENHGQLDKCFACDSILVPSLSADILDITFDSFPVLEKVQEVVVNTFVPLSHVYYSLRAPPVLA